MKLDTRLVYGLIAGLVAVGASTIAPAVAAMPTETAAAPVVHGKTHTGIQTYTAPSQIKTSPLPTRGSFTVYVKPKPKPVIPKTPKSSTKNWVPPHVTPNPGTAQATARQMIKEYGWGEDDFACLVSLWNKESGWRVNALNSSSGAYGIPQSLPGNKMASAGGDWQTNPATQIRWGLNYIKGRYGSPCGAWAHSVKTNWY